MVTIAELKPIEEVRHGIMKQLSVMPMAYHDLMYDKRVEWKQLEELERLRLVENVEIEAQNDRYYWLTEAGWAKLEQEAPEDYGDPTCGECEGTGKDAVSAWFGGDVDDDDEQDECWICGGSGIDSHFIGR